MTYSVKGSAPGPGLRTYGVRWYLLAVVSLHCCLQNAVWAEYPPIAQSAKLVYDWTDSDINMTLNYGNIGAIFLLIPVIWIVFAKGNFWQYVKKKNVMVETITNQVQKMDLILVSYIYIFFFLSSIFDDYVSIWRHEAGDALVYLSDSPRNHSESTSCPQQP